MRRMAVLLVLLLGLIGIAAPTLVPTPWRYGAIYWVGAVPEYPQAYVNMASNRADQVFRFWGMVSPRASGDWETRRVVTAPNREEARRDLGEDFSPAGLVVPSPEEGTFWALPPLLLGEREIQPLTLLVFPDLRALQDAYGVYGMGAAFFYPGAREVCPSLLEPWFRDLLAHLEGPVVIVSIEGSRPASSEDRFLQNIAHEVAHWATWLWCEMHGVDMRDLAPLLLEGLADYTTIALHYGPPDRLPLPPGYLYPAAAVWSQKGRLQDTPPPLYYEVGLSLVDFLVRRLYSFSRVLNSLPELVKDWAGRLAEWEGEWQDWFKGGLAPMAHVRYRIITEGVYFAAQMVQPLIPTAWDFASQITTEAQIDRFWALFSGPTAEPSPEAWKELRKWERLFSCLAETEGIPEEVRAYSQEIVDRLRTLREAEDWAGYAAAYLEVVLTFFERQPLPAGVSP